MEETHSGLNWLAIIVSALASLPIGFIWYNEKVFGRAWMNSINMKPEDARGANMPLIFGVTIAMSLILAINFARLMAYHGNESMTFGHGIFHGSEAALYLIMPVIIVNALFEKRGLKYMLIVTGYWLVTFCVIAGILSVWR